MKKVMLCSLSFSLTTGRRRGISNVRWLLMWRLNHSRCQWILRQLMTMEIYYMLVKEDHGLRDKVCLKILSKTLGILIINGKFLIFQTQILGILLCILNINPCGITNLGNNLHLTSGNNKIGKPLHNIDSNIIKISSYIPINGNPRNVTGNNHLSGSVINNIMPCRNLKFYF
jgi:hypothetical protein